MATNTVPSEVLQRCDRFEWERIVRRCQIPGPVKLVAFVLAQYANADGSNIHPGTRVIAAVCGIPARTVERYLATLRNLGLVEKVANGGGRNALAAKYRLTIPADLMDRVPMLDPDERTPATRMAAVPPVNSRRPDGGSCELPPSELPPSQNELPPNGPLTPANDPPVTCDNAHHQPDQPTHQPIRDLGGNPHQGARGREERLIHRPANLDLRAGLRGRSVVATLQRGQAPLEVGNPLLE